MTLRECFDAHMGRPIGKIDHFFDVYESHFVRFRDTPVRLLEIGVHQGGSLELWRRYFGEQAHIHGIDIEPAAAARAPEDCPVHIGSQEDADFLARVCQAHGPFDIVIDDGSHLMAHQIRSFECLYPRLSERGLYVCEDAFTSYWPAYGGGPGADQTFMDYARTLVDELHADWSAEAEPTEFTRGTRGIHFYSGTVIFERQPTAEPVYITRGSGGESALGVEALRRAAEENLGYKG